MSDKIMKMVELARAHVESGGINSAGVYYRMILKDTSPPKTGVERVAHGEAAVWYARKALAEGRVGQATDWYRQALQADARATDIRNEYCIKALVPMGMHKNARIEAERATKIDPENVEAWHVLGGMEHVLGNVDASRIAYDRQIELDPLSMTARLDRATLALDVADYETVRDMCEPVLESDQRADALHLMAMVAYREGRHEDAVDLYRKAIAGGCYDPKMAEWNMSLAMHSIGSYVPGWKAHEARGKQRTDGAMALMMNRFVQPMWQGSPAPARLHVHQEMGMGDVIAMLRYLPLLTERGYEVCVEVADSLVGLVSRSFPDVKVMAKSLDYPGAMGVPPFDYHVPMLSLPALFGTDVSTVPWRGSYLKPDPELAKMYASKIIALETRDYDQKHAAGEINVRSRKIGLCWSSGIRKEGLWISEYGKRKSASIDDLLPIISPNWRDTFVSLQVGPERADNDMWQIVDLLPEKPNWDDTAALVSCLDVVVTVDTSVAHLAGALGKPLMLLMHTEGSWHWMAARDGRSWNTGSPWYPSAQLFRQTKIKEWHGPVARVVKELERIPQAQKICA